MLTASELKSLLKANRLRLSKKLGQNHLIDAAFVARIVDACQLNAAERVVEIGAGLGALTQALSQKAAEVLAVEVDKGICRLLIARAAAWSRVSVRCQDILTLPESSLAQSVVVGAVPYRITSSILAWLTQRRQHLRRAILVVQKEVAQRMAASSGTKTYGRLSLLAQYGWQVETLFLVPRSAFFPQPEVDSVCLRLLPRREALLVPQQEAVFFALIKAAFAQRRKQLVNSLQAAEGPAMMSRQRIEEALKRLSFSPSLRGEDLSLQDFIHLTHAFSE